MGWTINDMKRKGFILKDNKYIPVSTLVDKKESKPNAKVKNATKTEVDGIVFDSKLESAMYRLLKGAGIEFERQKVFVLQGKFRYNGEAVREIKSIVDFFLPRHNMICDTKGYANDIAPVKYKLLKKLLLDIAVAGGNTPPRIEMPSTLKECEELILILKYDK